jgi:hypothetical protein
VRSVPECRPTVAGTVSKVSEVIREASKASRSAKEFLVNFQRLVEQLFLTGIYVCGLLYFLSKFVR